MTVSGVSRRPAAIATIAMLGLLGGCRPAQPPEPPAVTSTAQRGPIEFRISAAPPEVWVGDSITLELSARTPPGFVVSLPEATEYGELELRSYGPIQSQPTADGNILWRQRVVLDALVSGPLEVPPLILKYQSAAAATQPGVSAELASDTLRIEVRSALTTQDSLTLPRDITGTLLPPPPPWPWWLRAAVAGGALLVCGAVYLAVRWLRRWRARPAAPLAPELWALRELAELERSDWLSAGRMRDYYYRLTGIVREYIERQFGLAAPEMTTDEFLLMLGREHHRLPYDRARLRAFLEACDFVKYAAFEPRREDAEHVLATARALIHATAAASRPEAAEAGAVS